MKTLSFTRFGLIGLALSLVLTACPDLRPALRSNLESNKTLWASQNIRSYRFTYGIFMAPSGFAYTITVSNGVFQSAIDVYTKQPVEASVVESIKTIEAVFQRISTDIESNQLETVKYDSRGIPISTQGKTPSCVPGVQDCFAGSSSITDFTVLP
jgi:Family of unknown function (DUF6174)